MSANIVGLTHVIHAYDPEKIVIMGSLGLKQFDKIIPSKKLVKEKCFLRPIPPILKSNIGDKIGLLGAYVCSRKIR